MFEQFRNKFPLDDAKWVEYTNCFTRMEVPAKTVLIHEGDISDKTFLIEKGCIRAFLNDGEKDVTFQFFFENNIVASIESFRKQLPSLGAIETIEPSILWVIQKKDFDRIIHEIIEIPVLRDKVIDVIFERTYVYMKHHCSFISDTPQQRYLNLITETPQVIQRVPQHYIASYLGVSTVHLSRIKRKLVKG
ncbi:Crp/Fnr family transcriptional regulator [uncultured Bacteroides sp.]|uniref:Crp/Fnr family transcriptional regulator n=1 Tax=uncultured Bacteroides sp. TaxID=162156 RepID=UPI002AA61326|nr:Crp/Fnr family transcriptional regulator [uncultured Bacteroides sp.]